MTTWSAIYPAFGEPPKGTTWDDYVFVPSVLAEDSVLDELFVKFATERRDKPLAPYTRDPRTKHWLDLGGIAWAKRKLFEIGPFDGLTLSVPASNVEEYTERLPRIETESVTLPSGLEVFGIASHIVSLLVNRKQLEEIRKALVAILPEAVAIAEVENQRFNEQMQEAVARGVPILPSYRKTGRAEEA